LSCTKHMRFSGLFADTPAPTSHPTLSDETVNLILSKLAKLDALEQAFTATQQATIVTPVQDVEPPNNVLPEHAESVQQASGNAATETTDTERTGERANGDYADRIEAL